jgi:uncharacterized membrane protein YqjE
MTTDGMPPQDTGEKSLGEIVADVSEKASQLVREEIELAKAEVKEKVSKLTTGAAVAAAAGVFVVFGITTFFHALAWLLNDIFNWESTVWPGYAMVTALLFLLAILAGLVALRLFKKGSPPMPELAIEEARRTRAELEAQKTQRDQVPRSLERGEEVKA